MEHPTQNNRPASTGETANRKPARRREVYPSDEVAHRWANAADAFDIRGGNLSTRRGDGKANAVWLYSYRMPIGVRFLHKGRPVWFVVPSESAPSRTSVSHIWQAARAVPEKANLFRVPVITGGNVGAVSYFYGGPLTPPDADAHRRNLDALVAFETEFAQASARRRSSDAIMPPATARERFAKVDLYRHAFLPRRKPVACPESILQSLRDGMTAATRRESEAALREQRQAQLDWNFLRPEIERLSSAHREQVERARALRAAAVAEVEAAAAAGCDWSEWLAGGPAPKVTRLPSRWGVREEEARAEWPAYCAFIENNRLASLFDIAVSNLIHSGVFKRRVRYCWGNEQRDPYPTRRLREICASAIPEAVEGVDDGQEIEDRLKRASTPTLLRVGADGRVESTHGARVPLAIVKRAWDRFGPIVARAAAGADRLTDEDRATLADSLPCGLDPYTLTAIDAEGVRVGCHNIPPAEVVRFAATQGWTAGVPA